MGGVSLVAAVGIITPVVSCASSGESAKNAVSENWNASKTTWGTNAVLKMGSTYTFAELIAVLDNWLANLTTITGAISMSIVRTQTFNLASNNSVCLAMPVGSENYLSSNYAKTAVDLGIGTFASEQILMWLFCMNNVLENVWNGTKLSVANAEINNGFYTFDSQNMFLTNLFGEESLAPIKTTTDVGMFTLQQIASVFAPFLYYQQKNLFTNTYLANYLRFYNTYAESKSTEITPFGSQIVVSGNSIVAKSSPQINTLSVYYSPDVVGGVAGVTLPNYNSSTVAPTFNLSALYQAANNGVLSVYDNKLPDFWENNAWFYSQMLTGRNTQFYLSEKYAGRIYASNILIGNANVAINENPFFYNSTDNLANFSTFLANFVLLNGNESEMLINSALSLEMLDDNVTNWNNTKTTTLSALNTILSENGLNEGASWFQTHFLSGIAGISGTKTALYDNLQAILSVYFQIYAAKNSNSATILTLTLNDGVLYNVTNTQTYNLVATKSADGVYSLNWTM